MLEKIWGVSKEILIWDEGWNWMRYLLLPTMSPSQLVILFLISTPFVSFENIFSLENCVLHKRMFTKSFRSVTLMLKLNCNPLWINFIKTNPPLTLWWMIALMTRPCLIKVMQSHVSHKHKRFISYLHKNQISHSSHDVLYPVSKSAQVTKVVEVKRLSLLCIGSFV